MHRETILRFGLVRSASRRARLACLNILIKITEWAQKWRVTFNAGKSKDIIFSGKTLNNSPPIIFDNKMIERVNEHKHLGIYLSSSLDWSRQVHEIGRKASKKLSILGSVEYLNRHTVDIST